jgi:MFS-type transporter involved in bile tolerance (Atg22 family)
MTARHDARPRDDRREITGWLMYDWANSAFQTTVVTVLIGPYLTALAQRDAGRNGVVADLGPFGTITATSLFPTASRRPCSFRCCCFRSLVPSRTSAMRRNV